MSGYLDNSAQAENNTTSAVSKGGGHLKSSRLSFSEKLAQATSEDKQINELYKHELRKQFNKLKDDEWDCQLLTIDIDNPIYFNTDGIFSCSYFESVNNYLPFYMLMECKLDKDFNIPEQKAEVLTQVVAYLAQIYFCNFVNNDLQRRRAKDVFKLNETLLNKMEIMPSTVFVGSKLTCFAVDTTQLKIYYTNSLDFNSIKSASTFKNTVQGEMIYENLLRDSMLETTSPVFNTSNKYCIADIADIIYRYNKNIKEADDLSTKNLYRAFTRFTTRVLTQETVERLSNREQIDLFAQFIVNRKAIKQEMSLDGELERLSVRGLSLDVNSKEWNTFSWIYNLKQYNIDEQKKITAITDQLISEDDRRRKGDFYTPSIWVEEAHKLLDRNLEQDWRDNYMVWDCAWGTGNLTRDCTKLNGTYIKDLYCSTLHETDLEIGARYNANATKFQYDFLNDDVEDFERIETLCKMRQFDTANAILFNTKLYKQAPGLIDGLLGINGKEKKKLLFLINPPYAGVGNMGNASSKGNKTNSTVTLISESMKDNDIKGTNNLYMQFMYRIIHICKLFGTICNLALFCPADIMNNPTGKDIRKLLNINGGLTDGFVFKASHFADVSDTWGIAFSLWTDKKGEQNLQIKGINELGKVTNIGYKKMLEVPADKELLKKIKTKIKSDTEEIFRVTSGINIDTNHSYIRPIKSMGSCMMDTANVSSNQQRVNMVNTRTNGNWSIIDIMDDNIMDVMSAFSARRMVKSDWLNYQDKYMYPDKSNAKYSQYEADAMIYCLFESKMQISSLRNIYYNGKHWDIQNEFFWMSVKDMAELATGKTSTDNFDETVCDDIEKYGDNRFVYKKLQEVTLSPDAQAVLDKATEIVKKSFKYRKQFNQLHPEYHINAWDAGWYQIKGLCKEYPALKADMEEFNTLYKAFEDRMRPLVYELGFLYK